MKTGYGLTTGDSLGYLSHSAKPFSSLPYGGGAGSKGYSSLTSSGLKSAKYGAGGDKDTFGGRAKKTKSRKLSTDKIDTPLYKKKTFDFTDYAYREAVNRLKFLLTEAYEPTKVATSIYYRGVVDDTKSEASDNQSIVERPSMTEVSKYFNPGTVSRYNSGGAGLGRRYSFLNQSALKPAVSTASLHPAPSVCSVSQNLEVAQPPPELLGFIEKQETYIEQLEKESQYCREELSTLLKKVKDVVSENEALTDRSRSKALYQMDSSESEDLDIDRMREKGRLSGPNIVFESRISELEAQLAQSQIDLKKLFNENEENKRKLVHGTSDASCADVYRKQVENLQRDKHNLEETVRKLQLSIDQLKDTEATNFSKTQRSRDMIEHVAFERNQAELEIRRLKDELERQHERVREIQHEMSKRLAEERSNAERRYTFQVDQLGGDLSSQWEQATKLQLEVERMKRIESDYKREISQKNSQIDELKMELKNKTAIFMSDLNQASAEKQSLEQEITSLRLQLERAERQSKVEVSRLNAEITSLRQRLDRSDADLLHSKRENLKLSDEVASLEKELTLGELNKETRPSKELAKIISDMEAKHGSKNVSRAGSTAAQYRQPTADDVPASRPSQGKVSRPESQTSDRQQYGKQPQQQQELSRTSSVNDYNESKGKRSDSRLSRASISNEDATKLQGKEPEFGRPDGERSSRVGAGGGDSAKPDGTGSSGRLSRESTQSSRQSIRQSYGEPVQSSPYVSELVEQPVEQYPPTTVTQQGSVDQSYAQPADQYQPSDETYAQNTAGYDTSQYDPSQQQQQYDPSQYEGYGDQQQYVESYDPQQTYDPQQQQQQQYQDYQQPYDAQQYTTEQVYDEPSSYPTGSAQSPTQQPAPAPVPTAAPVPLEQAESARNVGYARGGPRTGGTANGAKQQYKQPAAK
ncbi:nucleoprotein TPR isoform X4 [Culex pipiens pallens]|uniref:nucleoprotein TPR isoform X4 n=1 Tax=Culex pipiens pallens TaxID=42434 RepID=UPI001952C393|nr:nucleoprotein TPR isoform X4 [Culex pipiens pallens]